MKKILEPDLFQIQSWLKYIIFSYHFYMAAKSGHWNKGM